MERTEMKTDNELFGILRIRARAYNRVNPTQHDERRERLAKLAMETDSIRRKSVKPVTGNLHQTSDAENTNTEGHGNVSRLPFACRKSIPRTPVQEVITEMPKSKEEEESERQGKEQQEVNIKKADIITAEDEHQVFHDTEQPPTQTPRGDIIRGTTSHTNPLESGHAQALASYDQTFVQMKNALYELNDRMVSMEQKSKLYEETQENGKKTLARLTENQRELQDQMRGVTENQALLTETQRQLQNQLSTLTNSQSQGFETLTNLILSMQKSTTTEQQQQSQPQPETQPIPVQPAEQETTKEKERICTEEIKKEAVINEVKREEKEVTKKEEVTKIGGFYSQHKADKPEKYDGKIRNNALEKWITLVENYARATKIGQEELLLFAISNLKEQAADWWLATSINQEGREDAIKTFDDMKAAMRCYFADHASRSDVVAKLRTLQERTSVAGYTQEFLRLRLLCPAISEQLATQYYLEGLKQDIRPHVALQRPQTVSAAVELAVVAATTTRKIDGREERRQDRPQRFNERRNFQERKKSDNPRRFINNAKPQDQKSVKTCHFCKKPGHLIAECRKKLAQEKDANQKGKFDNKKKPIRKNNIQYSPSVDDEEGSSNSDLSDNDCMTLKVNCLEYWTEELELAAAAYDRNRSTPHELITLIAHINGRKARILVDSGAGGNFISEEFAKIFRIRKNKMETPVKIQYADKRKENCTHEVRNAKLTIGQYETKLQFIVAPLAYDAILGKPWLTKENPDINWQTNKVWVVKENTRIALPNTPVNANTNNLINPISYIQMKEEAEQEGTRTFLITIQDEKGPPKDPFATSKQPEMARKIMKDFPTVFAEEHPGGLPQQTDVQHTIEIEDRERPPCRPLQLMSQAELEELRKQLDAYLEKGWIKASDSPYGAQVLFALKKDGSKRLCIDYRALNKITKKSKYPLPRFEEVQAMIGTANLFSKIDLSNGYHQVRMAPEDTHKTAFRTRFGQYEWCVMPFGLTNAPATFQRLINNVLRPLQNKTAAGILDDILIFTKGTAEEHDRDIREVVELLKKHNLIAKPQKCSFFEEEVEYWGHVITKHGWTTEKHKIEAIKNWPSPLPNVHAVRSFLGICAYYRRYVKNFTQIAVPLHELVRKEGEFQWTKQCDEAVRVLKERLTTTPVLKVADCNKPFVITTDASHFAIGAVLQQYDDEEQLRPVAFESRKLKINRNAKQQDMGEVRYPTHEKEMLAIIHALKVWRHLLLGNKVTIYTDHMPLKYLQKQNTLSDRQIRWTQLMQQYDFEILYKPGKENTVADALSRRCDLASIIEMKASDTFVENLKEEYNRDASTKEMKELCKNSETHVFKQGNRVFVKDEVLCVNKNGKILVWIPAGAVTKLINLIHDEQGHPGKGKLTEILQRKYWWPKMAADINRVVRMCDTCSTNKSSQQKPQGLLHPLPAATAPWERIAIDLVTDLPTTNRGYDAILSVTDTFTKFIYILPTTKTCTAKQLANLLFENIIRNHGVPKIIVSDRDPRFLGDFWKAIWTRLDTQLAMSTAYHPQSDGQSERSNRSILQQLRMKVNEKQEDWDLKLPLIQLFLNNTVNETTGFSPQFANFHTHPRLPPFELQNADPRTLEEFLRTRMDTTKEIRDNIGRAQQRWKKNADQHRRPCEIQRGNMVLLSTKHLRFRGLSKKLAPRYIGPFKVTKVINEVSCTLQLPDKLKIHNVFHASLLKLYVGAAAKVHIHPGFLSQEPIDEFEVEAILQHREDVVDGKKQRFFLIKWKNADVAHATWEPEGHLANAKGILRTYLRKTTQK